MHACILYAKILDSLFQWRSSFFNSHYKICQHLFYFSKFLQFPGKWMKVVPQYHFFPFPCKGIRCASILRVWDFHYIVMSQAYRPVFYLETRHPTILDGYIAIWKGFCTKVFHVGVLQVTFD